MTGKSGRDEGLETETDTPFSRLETPFSKQNLITALCLGLKGPLQHVTGEVSVI